MNTSLRQGATNSKDIPAVVSSPTTEKELSLLCLWLSPTRLEPRMEGNQTATRQP